MRAFSKVRAKRRWLGLLDRVALCLLVVHLGCGTLAEGDGGGDNLPSRGIVPFTPLQSGDHLDVSTLPLVLVHDTSSLDEPCALVSETQVLLYVAASGEGASSILRATSSDGIAFGPPEEVLVAQSDWEESWVGAPSVVLRPDGYHLWYVGGLAQPAIGYARSSDGIRWQREFQPVLEAQPDEQIGSPSVVPWDGGFAMYFGMIRGSSEEGQSIHSIERADSTDGLVWTRTGPVLEVGTDCLDYDGRAATCWDAGYVSSPGVRVASSPTGRRQVDLWYTGGNSTNSDIGFAGSFDGATFSRYRLNPVIDSDEPDYAPDVISFGGDRLLYYVSRHSRQWGIGLAWDRW